MLDDSDQVSFQREQSRREAKGARRVSYWESVGFDLVGIEQQTVNHTLQSRFDVSALSAFGMP
jgi:hypothetical protein